MLIYRNAEVVHGQRKFDNTSSKTKTQSRRHGGALVGLVPQTKLQAPPKLKHETL